LWRVETCVFLALWVALMVAGRSRFFADPGSFWHPVVGERILSSGELIRSDPFSFTFQGKPWIAQQWLGECALALLHRLGGLDTLVLATAAFLAGLYTWVVHRLLRVGMHPLLAVFLTGLAMAASSYHFHPRPHLINLALLGLTFAWLCDFEAGRLPLRHLFNLIPLFVLWTNVHGGMVGGLATLALAVTGWALAGLAGWRVPPIPGRHLALLGFLVLACGLTVFVNPYGPELPRVWVSLLASPMLPRLIDEHAPLLHSASSAWPVLALGVVYLAALLGTLPARPRVTWLIPLVWFGLAWTRTRHGPLFATTAVLALAEMFPHVRWVAWLAQKGSAVCRLRVPERAPGAGWAWGPALVPLTVVVAALGLQAAGLRVPVLGRGWARPDADAWPVALLPELRAYERGHPKGTRIFNEMIYGGFLIYYTPDLRVFIDDRCELYGDAWLVHYADALVHHPGRIDDWADEYGFDRALVQRDSGFDRYLRDSSRWTVVGRTQTAALYQRGTSSAPQTPGGRREQP
jgi:hypothetical protein